jgi:hypothetical protein
MKIEEYQRLKKQAEALERRAERAKGRLAQMMQQLKTDFDCDNLEDAKTLLGQMEEELKEAERELAEQTAAFQEEWGDELDQVLGASE